MTRNSQIEERAAPPAGALPIFEALSAFAHKKDLEEYDRLSHSTARMPKSLRGKNPPPWNKLKTFEHRKRNKDGVFPCVFSYPITDSEPMEEDIDELFNSIVRSILDGLIEGKLVGWVQNDPPFGVFQKIPASFWKSREHVISEKGLYVEERRNYLPAYIEQSACSNDNLPIKKGRPGRPKKGPKILRIFQERAEKGAMEKSLNAEARAIKPIYEEQYPEEGTISESTIQKTIRDQFHKMQRSISEFDQNGKKKNL